MTIKKIFQLGLLCSLLTLTLHFTSVAQGFEGIIYYQVPEMANQGMDEMPYMVKGEKARMEFGQGQEKGAMVLLSGESKIVLIMDAMKSYMEMDYSQESDTDDASYNADATVTKTGETKTIAGRSCEVWKIDSEKNSVEACMAKGLGTFMIPQNPMSQKNTPAWAQEIMKGGAMPLEVLEIKDDGSKSVQMKATRIEEKTLSPDLFTVPPGYNNMTSMMKQMMNQKRN